MAEEKAESISLRKRDGEEIKRPSYYEEPIPKEVREWIQKKWDEEKHEFICFAQQPNGDTMSTVAIFKEMVTENRWLKEYQEKMKELTDKGLHPKYNKKEWYEEMEKWNEEYKIKYGIKKNG